MPKRKRSSKGFTKSSARGKSYGVKRKKIPSHLKGFVRTSGFYGGGSDELKFLDVATSDAVVAKDSFIVQNAGSIVNIPQGTSQSERDGRKCVVKSIGWHFTIDYEANISSGLAAGPSPATIRVMMYLDKQCNGATATNTDLVVDATSLLTFNNLSNSGRFRTLMDRTYTLTPPGGGGPIAANNDWAGASVTDSFYKKCSIPLEFNSTTGAITEIRSNNIGWMCILQFDGVGAEPAVEFKGICRIRFMG